MPSRMASRMPNVLERVPTGARVAIIRLRSLGDCVLTTPAIALLKAHRPDLRITVIAETRFAGVFEGNPDIDEIRAGARRADLALNLHGGTRSMAMTLATRATLRAGFEHHAGSAIYNLKIPRAQEVLNLDRRVHTAEHLASAVFFLGVPQTEIPRARLFAATDAGARRARPYAVIHPFASAPDKTWPADRFQEIARKLQPAMDAVILAGPADDASAFDHYEVVRGRPLGEVKSLLSGAQIFIGNDSGPAHMAAAFGIPVVVLFGSSDPVTWAPWRTESQVLRSPDGIAAIGEDAVLAAVESLGVKA